MTVRILKGDCRDVLRELEPESVHCVVTSPPYWGLLDYGVAGQIGLEGSFAGYVEQMRNVFDQVRRVLRSDGTVWLNLGDSYAGGGRGGNPDESPYRKQATNTGSVTGITKNKWPMCGLKPKDLVGIPWRVAFALQADGWYLRSDIIWSKPNPMPESVTDRPTKSHEYIFLLSKSERYWYDAEAIAENLAESTVRIHSSPNVRPQGTGADWKQYNVGNGHSGLVNGNLREGKRNRRSVWEVATTPFSGARLMRDGGGGSGRKVSPDCPLHGDQSRKVSTAQYGGRSGASQSARNPDIESRPVPGLFDVPAPIETPRVERCVPDNLDYPVQPCESPATDRNNENRKKDRVPSILPHENGGALSERRTGGNALESESAATSAHTPESKTGEDCALNEKPPGPLVEMISDNARICTCEEYSTPIDHFAVFPPQLIEPCILAGCPKQCCAKCGAPWVRDFERVATKQYAYQSIGIPGEGDQRGRRDVPKLGNSQYQGVGFSPSCSCTAGTVPGTCLDPFGGAGTTGMVADRLGRNAILIELNPEYAEMAERRIKQDAGFFAEIAAE